MHFPRLAPSFDTCASALMSHCCVDVFAELLASATGRGWQKDIDFAFGVGPASSRALPLCPAHLEEARLSGWRALIDGSGAGSLPPMPSSCTAGPPRPNGLSSPCEWSVDRYDRPLRPDLEGRARAPTAHVKWHHELRRVEIDAVLPTHAFARGVNRRQP